MVSHQKRSENLGLVRRFAFQCSIILASGMQVGEGQVLNMSGSGWV